MLEPGDALVMNDTVSFKARLHGQKGRNRVDTLELLLLKNTAGERIEVLTNTY